MRGHSSATALANPLPPSVTREEARNAVIDYIERRYNRNRPHSTIGYQVPAKAMEAFFERTKPAAEDAAAKPACAERMAA